MKFTIIILSFLIATGAIAEITNIVAEGNLEAKVELAEISDITNTNTPPEIFNLLRSKIEQEEYDGAASAFFIGSGYAMYDMQRVADKSAHQALRVLQTESGKDIEEEKLQKFQSTLNTSLEDPDKIIALLEKVGKPDYYPTYMIQHGMGAFKDDENNDELISDFDPDKAWQGVLDTLKK